MDETEIREYAADKPKPVRVINTHYKTCGSKAVHGPHYHKVEVEKICDGKTPCGAKSHEPHSYTGKDDAQCRGICNCDYVSHPHDPSRHSEGKAVFDPRLTEPIFRQE